MPQEFQVLQCYSCKTFQVHHVKKAKKWACKLCGEKQSIIKVYGQGTGAECRQHVQSLNTHRGEIDMLKETFKDTKGLQGASQYTSDDCDSCYLENVQESENKWSQFVDNTSHVDDDDDGYDDRQFTTDASLLDKKGKSRKRKRETPIYQNSVKSSKFDDFIDQPDVYDDDCDDDDCERLHASYPNKQGARMTGEYTKRDVYRGSVNYRQTNNYILTDRDTTTKLGTQTEVHKYGEDKLGCQNQAFNGLTGSSKWSSFGENYELQENGFVTDQLPASEDVLLQAKGSNSTLILNRNKVELGPLAFKDGAGGGYRYVDSNSAPMSYKSSKLSMYEEQSSQESCDNSEESQIDTRIYVDFKAPLHDTQTDVSDKIPKCKNVSTNGKSQDSIPKPTSSKWCQFVSVDAEDEGLVDLSNDFSYGNYDASEPTRIGEKTAIRSENVENDDKICRKVFGVTNAPFEQKSESIVNRTVLKEHSSQLNYGTKAYAKGAKDAKDNDLKVNKHISRSSVVDIKQCDVKNLFTTGDLSDEDFEL